MRTFADFSNQLLALKETLKKEEIANVAGDGAVSMPPTAKRVKKRKSKQFNVSPALFDMFRRGKKKFETPYAIDVHWKTLQRGKKFYIFNPHIVKPSGSYSEIMLK